MIRAPELPAIWLVQSDERLRAQWAAGLRRDGMAVVEFATAEPALEALRNGAGAAVLVTEPARGRLSDHQLADQARTCAPRIEIIFTPLAAADHGGTPVGAHVLAKPFDAFKLSRFIRLVAAKPALRAALQALYRQARSAELPARAAAQ
jgi:DNA-binding NtrC family response regulator